MNGPLLRIEGVRKSGDELGFLGGDVTLLYDVRSYVLGVMRRFLVDQLSVVTPPVEHQ